MELLAINAWRRVDQPSRSPICRASSTACSGDSVWPAASAAANADFAEGSPDGGDALLTGRVFGRRERQAKRGAQRCRCASESGSELPLAGDAGRPRRHAESVNQHRFVVGRSAGREGSQ